VGWRGGRARVGWAGRKTEGPGELDYPHACARIPNSEVNDWKANLSPPPLPSKSFANQTIRHGDLTRKTVAPKAVGRFDVKLNKFSLSKVKLGLLRNMLI